MTDEIAKVLPFPAGRSAGRLLPLERRVLEAFAAAQHAEIEFANIGDENSDQRGVACDRACLDFGDRLIWKVMRAADETDIMVQCGEMTAARYPTLVGALEMLGREPWRLLAMRRRNGERALRMIETEEASPPDGAA